MSYNDVTYSAENVQRLLQCAVCLDRFKQPKQLPCQHTFCLRPCLEGLVDRRTRMLRCPECRADHIVPRAGVGSFPNNLTIIGFLELAAVRGGGEGGGGEGAVGRDAPFTDVSQSHRSVQQQAASPPSPPLEGAGAVGSGCSICHSEGRIIRCSHCDQLVCEMCKRSHMESVQSDLNRLIGQIRRGLPRITEQIAQVGRRGNILQNSCETVKSEITDAVQKHMYELQSRERTLQEDVDTFLVNELRALRTFQENLEVEIASIASFCDSSESTLSRSRRIPDGDLVEMRRQCCEHMETVHAYEDGTIRLPTAKQIQISAESPFLSSTITNFGDLIITSSSNQTQTPRQTNSLAVPAPQQQQQQRYDQSGSPRQWQQNMSDSSSTSRSPSRSPAFERRRVAQPSGNRTAQVMYADEDSEGYDRTSNWMSLVNAMRHPRRRPRGERNSDTRVSGVMGSGGPTLTQQMRDRTRHRSLGALPAAPEESSPERDTASPPIPTHRNRNREDDDPYGEDQLAATFPAARRPGRQSLRFDIPVGGGGGESLEASDMESGALVAFSRTNNSPSMYVNTPRNKYNQKGTAMIRFGERGNEPRQFTWPRGIAVSPLDDNIYVADSSNHRVQVFDKTGRFIKLFGTYGQDEGEFDCLAGIAVNGLGQVIIADRYNHRIQIFDRHGTFQSAFSSEGSADGQLNYPWGVSCDSMGFIYVCDKENHRIQVFQSNGTFVRKFGRLGGGVGQFENPHYIAVSPDNKVYVSDSSNHRIQVFSIYGDFLFSFGVQGTLRGQMKFPRGIAIDNQGFVVVADSGNNRIQIFRADGRYYSMFGGWGSENGQFKGLEGVSILANGNIVVSDRENHRVQVF